MALVVTGRLNKQIAHDIDISEITVKVTAARSCER
jgi:FixJ family two-component response regulator